MERKARELTGRMVLVWLLGFFGVVFAVNAVMVKAATETFGGVEVASSYKAGLKFEQDVADAQRQDTLNWHIEGKLSRDARGEAVLEFSARDRTGVALSGLTAEARLVHPANDRLDRAIALRETATGRFTGLTEANAGQWELVIDLSRGADHVFRSKSRVTLR